jgi:hypothetical protein
VYRGGPLPSISQRRGITLLLGGVPNGDMLWLFAELFTALQGKVQHVKDDAQFKVLFSVDCMMGPFYYQLKVIRDWLINTQGIDPVTASEMVGWTFNGIAGDAKDLCSSPEGFDELIAEQVSD